MTSSNSKLKTKNSKLKRSAKRSATAFADGELVKSQRLAGRYAGVSERTVRRWVKAGMPRTAAGHYFKAMLDVYKSNEGSQPTEAKKKGQTADAEYKDAKAKLMQMDLDVREGQLVPLGEIEQGRVQRILAVKRALMGQGRKLGPQLANTRDARKCQKIIDDDNRAIIEAFSAS